jgi:hypothetical protein
LCKLAKTACSHKEEQTYRESHPYTSLTAEYHEESKIRKQQSIGHLKTHNRYTPPPPLPHENQKLENLKVIP